MMRAQPPDPGFSRPLWVHTLRPSDSLTTPRMALSVGSVRFVSSADATQATGFLTPTPVGLPPTEHASLRWTHIISPLPPVLAKTCCAARPLRSTGVTRLPRYSEPNRHRLAVSRFPGVPGYTAYLAPPISRWDEDGFSSCLTCPCHRAAPNHPAGVSCRLGQPATRHPAFAPKERARPPELFFVEATCGFTFVTAR
jgi:hypothetical protein